MNDPAIAILIAHISDLHVSSASSKALSRLRQIAGAIGSRVEEPTVIVLAITGDVAATGKQPEYQLAETAIAALTDELSKWKPVGIFVIPCAGNHDCDLTGTSASVRGALIDALSKPGDDKKDILEALAMAQAGFKSFAMNVSNSELTSLSPLVSQLVINVHGVSYKFITVNTAISSKLYEVPGTLCMPETALPRIERDADYCIVLAHHPLNWFNPHDAIVFAEWLDRSADLVLWGHEHRLDEFTQSRSRTQSRVKYEIGLALDDPSTEVLGLRCRRITSASREELTFNIQIRGEQCSIADELIDEFQRNEARDRGYIRFSNSFLSVLDDPGATFTHPRISRGVRLSDLLVSQDFRMFTSKNASSTQTSRLSRRELFEKIVAGVARTVVYGPEQCGKTTFAKCFVPWAQQRGLIPVYLDGGDLRGSSRGDVRGWLNGAIRRQFEHDCHDAVESATPDSCIAIIDNAHMIRGGQEGVERVLGFLSAKYAKTLLLTADDPALSFLEVGATGDERAYLKGSAVFELLPLGHQRRSELIRRWVSIGRDSVDDAKAIESEARQVKALLDRVLGRDSLPKYPMFILMLLQQLEGMRQNRTVAANGSHGYLFEALITQSIDKHVRSHEIGTVHDFLAALAFDCWSRSSNALTIIEVGNIIQGFLDKLVRIDQGRLLSELDKSHIIAVDDGSVRFRYKYVYYYYLAKWICSNATDSRSNSLLDALCRLVHTELASNVLMFVAHLQQETRVIERLLPLVNDLYPDQGHGLRTLEDYSGLCWRFRTAAQRATLLDGEPRIVSDRTNALEDERVDRGMQSRDRKEVDDTLNFNTTLKSIGTLGQVLKSRATSLSSESKIEIAKAILYVARRLMGFLYAITEGSAAEIVTATSTAFEKAFEMNKDEAIRIANALIGSLVFAIANICMARASDAVGSAELEPLLAKLSDDAEDIDTKLMLLVAKVSGERDYPKERVEDFVVGLKPSNLLSRSVLGHAVARRFYLDPPNRRVRDSACRLLGIDVKPVTSSPVGLK